MQISLPVHSKVRSTPSWSSSLVLGEEGAVVERISEAVHLADSSRSFMLV